MRRGFKADAERHAARLRSELGVPASAQVNLIQLGQHIGVSVKSAEQLVSLEKLRRLDELQPGCWSAATFHMPDGRVIAVTNPVGSSDARRSSDLAHEMSHILLKHEVRKVQRVGAFSFFDCDPEQEEEANWLGGCLLLPRPLLLAAAKQGMSAEQLAETYGVSVQMARFRLNASGVYFQAKAAARRG